MKENKFINHDLRYSHLWNHRIDNSTEALCLSEFIDNSISSYLEKSENSNDIEGCIIKITIDETEIDNLKIEILDNANGMDEDCLDKASMEYNEIHDSSRNNKLNQWFIGMKFAIFWLGKNGKIWSKKKNENEYFLNYNALDKLPSEAVKTKSVISEDNCIKDIAGTKIVVEHLWNETGFKRKFTEEKFKQIIETLSFRYCNYIKKGLIIYFFKKTKDEPIEKEVKKIDKTTILENNIFNNKSFQIKNLVTDEKGEVDDKLHNEIHEYIRKFQNDVKNSTTLDNKIYIDFINKLKLNTKIEFTEKIELNGNSAEVKLCFLQKPQIEYCGIAILHENRFIKHPVFNKKISHSGNQLFFQDVRKSDGIWKWIYGELDITDEKKLGIKPDKNKSEIILDDDLRDQWEKQWEDVINKYKIFINFLQKIKSLSNKITEKSQREKIDRAKIDDSNLESINVIEGTPDLTYSTTDENENIISKYKIEDVEVILSPNNHLEKDFSYEQTDNGRTFKFEYNPNSILFKSEKSNEFSLIRLISLLQIIWDGDNIKTNYSLIEIINDILGNKYVQ